MLTRTNLSGVWAGLPTPFDSRGDLDTDCLAENIRRVCRFGISGVYGPGGAGEFYSVELDEFKRMTDVDEAARISRRITAFFNAAIVPLLAKGYVDCALDKATCDTAGLLVPVGDPRPPYRPLSAEDRQFLRAKMQEHEFMHDEGQGS